MPLIFSGGLSVTGGYTLEPVNLAATVATSSSTFPKDTAITAYTPVVGVNGTGTETYSVSPALPTGLSINSSTGQISGTPTTVASATDYTITFSNQYGSATGVTSISTYAVPANQSAYTTPELIVGLHQLE